MKQRRKGRWTAFLLAFAMVWTSLSIPSVDGENVFAASEDFVMDEDMEGYLEEYTGTDKDVVIPDGVKEIGYEVFKGRSDITSITLPDSVTKIWAYAFEGCSSLENIMLSQNLEYVAVGAFRNCSSLTEITIPKSTTMLPGGMFEGCSSLVKITVEEGNTEYDSRDNCNAIIEKYNGCLIDGCKTTVIPSDVKMIGANAFKGCKDITSISLPEDLYTIEPHAFADCSGLTEITLPENIRGIREEAFKNCSSLTAIRIPAQVNSIGDGVFHGCIGLTDITIAEENTVYDSRNGCNAVIETESDRLIAGCSKTEIPEGVKSIGTRAFQGCSTLKSITIPASVEDVDGAIFAQCDNLTSIKVAEDNAILDSRENCNAVIRTADNMLLAGCGATTIPEGVEIIFTDAFADCTSLTSIVLPESLISIRESAFSGCINLKSITIPRQALSIESKAFQDCDNLTIYGLKDSMVERYADNNNIPFKEIGSDTPKPDNPKYIIELPEGESSISDTQMADILEENKTKDVVIKNASGVTFTFEKDTMHAVDGKTVYDFGTELFTEYGSLTDLDFTEKEFALHIHYNYKGELPGTAKISIPVEGRWIGQRLYYYELGEDGEYRYISRTMTKEDGTYTVKQTHCSDYVAVTKVPENLGDCDGEEGITAKDALAVLKYDVGIPQENFSAALADCDGEDGITAKDALAILKHDVGLLDKLF